MQTRGFLENTVNPDTGEPYLKKITAVLLGENADEAPGKTKSVFFSHSEAIPDSGDWEKCAVVLDKDEEARELRRGW